MSEKRFIRNIVGDIYDSEKDKWFDEDWKGKPLDYDDDLIVFLNEQQATINLLLEELINAQQQGYVVDFLHKNEHCSLIPKELEDE